jgi:SAM-dependent methyltransferase
MRPHAGQRLLDLGGGDGSLAARITRRVPLEVTVADVESTRMQARERYGFRDVELAEDSPLPFADGEFDIVLCNSVIEHVTLPKAECLRHGISEHEWRHRSLEAQRRFAIEIRRVGRGYFVQTPHRAFPIDAHTWLPFTGFLPHDAARRLVAVTDRVWVKKCRVADWHLLGVAEMHGLFPDGTVHVERVVGLPKSIIAWRHA